MQTREAVEMECILFGKPGPANTDKVLDLVGERARELSVNRIVVATCSGRTALRARELLSPDLEVIAVTHVTGFRDPNTQELSAEAARELSERGVRVITTGHAFGGVGRAFRNKTGSYEIDEVVAFTLRIFGQGVKVACEIALMAADAGAVRTDEEVISIGGTAVGADTAVWVRPANTSKFFDLKLRAILCKPSDW